MKASAGSGKTFNLAKTYIRLLLCSDEPHMYRHILAVTFTNKATDEMKRRILKELHILSTDPASSKYSEDLLPHFGDSGKLKAKAGQALCDILHDYGAFAVCTIDSFFQQTLRAFSREIGQFPGYQVELDSNSLVEESVDRVLDSLSEDKPQLLHWLKESVMEDLREGKRYNLDNKLKTVAKGLKSDKHRTAVEEYSIDEENEYSIEHLKKLRKALGSVTSKFRKDVKEASAAFVKACGDAGLSLSDFSGTTFKKVFNIAENGFQGSGDVPSETLKSRCNDFGAWFRKADRERFAGLEGTLLPYLCNYCSLFEDRLLAFNTAKAISSNLVELGVASDIYREFEALLREKNVLCLGESNTILRDIIDGSDAPFVYEKIGVRYENFLLDEFQDTSRIQWENFCPLIKESDSSGNENLLVGDVKQSIYRWRGSDWKMMAGEVQAEFPSSVVEPLENNFRSLEGVVRFNNGLFPFCAGKLDSQLGDHGMIPITEIYSDSIQDSRTEEKEQGLVEAVFCDPEDIKDKVLETVRKILEAGSRPDETAILVRENKQGEALAMFLMANGIGVISDDSLYVKTSPVVRQVVALLSSVTDPDDTLNSFLAGEIGTDVKDIPFMSLSDLCEQLLRLVRARDEKSFDSQTQYVQAFMDFVQDYSSVYGNAIDGFLKKWQDSEPKISSPTDPDCVRIMTIHKSKGLEFRHVIFPFIEEMTLFRSEQKWARPDVAGTELEGIAEGVYNVNLSDPSTISTLFKKESQREKHLQYIDNLNGFYVAMTRAVATLTVIGGRPSDACLEAAASDADFKFTDFSQILAFYLESNLAKLNLEKKDENGVLEYSYGTMPAPAQRREDELADAILPGWPSFPLNPEPGDPEEDVRERGRLKFSADSLDFFIDEARASVSARLNGTVMHNILSKVRIPSDLPEAVSAAVLAGDVAQEDSRTCLQQLEEAVSKHPDWFPEDDTTVLSEVSLVDTDGRVYRPDRVIVRDGKVTVIDYKFGERNPRYRAQVNRYASIWSRMGYKVDKALIWYVPTDEVE